jgi:hypothetical protein
VHLAHRHRLQRLLGHLPQHGRGVEPDLGALRGRVAGGGGAAVVPHHVVQRRLQVGVGEALGDDAVDDRPHAAHLDGGVDAHDGADADRRVERGPEVELERRVGLALGGDDAA